MEVYSFVIGLVFGALGGTLGYHLGYVRGFEDAERIWKPLGKGVHEMWKDRLGLRDDDTAGRG